MHSLSTARSATSGVDGCLGSVARQGNCVALPSISRRRGAARCRPGCWITSTCSRDAGRGGDVFHSARRSSSAACPASSGTVGGSASAFDDRPRLGAGWWCTPEQALGQGGTLQGVGEGLARCIGGGDDEVVGNGAGERGGTLEGHADPSPQGQGIDLIEGLAAVGDDTARGGSPGGCTGATGWIFPRRTGRIGPR